MANPESAATDLVKQYVGLSDNDKKAAAAAIAELPAPPARYVGPLWIMVVAAFIVLLLGGTVLLFVQVQDKRPTTVIAALVTGALGVLAGLLVPSPVDSKRTGRG